jgi:hypothetical protein
VHAIEKEAEATKEFKELHPLPDGVMVAHGPLEARVKVRVLVGQPLARWPGRAGESNRDHIFRERTSDLAQRIADLSSSRWGRWISAGSRTARSW